jgi:hypothetical protein
MLSHYIRRSSTIATAVAVVIAAALAYPPATATVSAQSDATAPKKIALISMVGDEFSIVVQRQSTGSSIVNRAMRQTIRMPGQGINLSVLRGLDEAVRREYPAAERLLLTIPHDANTASVAPAEREAAAFTRAVQRIEQMPERQSWDRIVLVTPRWLLGEKSGMANRLSGIGLYVQPLRSIHAPDRTNQDEVLRDLGLQLDESSLGEDSGAAVQSDSFVAPFFYAVVTTLDAKTLRVIKREERYDFRKIANSSENSLMIGNRFDSEKLVGLIDKFIETAAIRSFTGKRGTVEIGPLRDSRADAASAKEAPR